MVTRTVTVSPADEYGHIILCRYVVKIDKGDMYICIYVVPMITLELNIPGVLHFVNKK